MTESAFKALVRDRECAHMSRELFAMQDAVVSADIIVRLSEGEGEPVGMYGVPGEPDPFDSAGVKGFCKMFNEVSRYVQETAWGEAALRHKGLLPKVKPFN